MKLPRVLCRKCGRPIAAGPVAGRLSKGRPWRHDPIIERREPGALLVSCGGSLEIVDLPYGQMEIPTGGPDPASEDTAEEESLLFVI
ncbi:hypothetical protein GCM10010387_15660 [Streptomyces inusitatus]|uniref:Uncharacterized protein n=1 Tax=Streptomyces inusitatus TaxID=68221 RepID=A0A918UNU0_9ACTN|nr:hypothetical protein [Streptomyces inusitatus]GGZ23381.1 hypothetical protein GCM10010387_15660 [Streptomyces inusitatus]